MFYNPDWTDWLILAHLDEKGLTLPPAACPQDLATAKLADSTASTNWSNPQKKQVSLKSNYLIVFIV